MEIAELLLEEGANKNIYSRKTKMSSLHWAAFHDDVDLVELLLQHEVEISNDKDGRSPLDIAAQGNKLEVSYFITLKTVKVFFRYFLEELAEMEKNKAAE